MKKISLFDVPDADERGVSPVIGVILMVAITVILAAVIATFVLGFPDQVNDNVKAGANVQADGEGGSVTWISEGNAESLNVSVSGDGFSETITVNNVGEVVNIKGGYANASSNQGNQTVLINQSNVDVVVVAVNGDTTSVVQQETINSTN